MNIWTSSVLMAAGTAWAASSVSLTIENTFPAQGKAMGLEVAEGSPYSQVYVLGTNNTDDAVYWYSTDGTLCDTTLLSPGNDKCFGAAIRPADGAVFTNDWESTDLFYTQDGGATWDTVQDPSGLQGRGICFEGDHLWSTGGYSSLLRFIPGGGSSQQMTLPQVYGQPSGLTVFPMAGGTGIAVTTYSDHNIWFYLWNGGDPEFLGSAPCPAECQASCGLAHSEERGTIFWSYRTSSGEYWISELSFETGYSLEPFTWASVKRSFTR